MQSFEISHVFDGTPDDYLAVIDAPGFHDRIKETLKLRERSVLERADHGSHELNTALGAVNTVVLICSSFTMAMGVHSAATGNPIL